MKIVMTCLFVIIGVAILFYLIVSLISFILNRRYKRVYEESLRKQDD